MLKTLIALVLIAGAVVGAGATYFHCTGNCPFGCHGSAPAAEECTSCCDTPSSFIGKKGSRAPRSAAPLTRLGLHTALRNEKLGARVDIIYRANERIQYPCFPK